MKLYKALVKTTYCTLDKFPEYKIPEGLYSTMEEAIDCNRRWSQSAHKVEIIRLIETDIDVPEYNYSEHPFLGLELNIGNRGE